MIGSMMEVSASGSEKSASTPSARAPAPKLRSCVVCRSRKVRCDKQSPCSNCRRANIPCTFPSTNRPPRWARGIQRVANNATVSIAPVPQHAEPDVGQVMERLRSLEHLVKELSGELKQAHEAASSAGTGSSGVNSPASSQQDRDPDHQQDGLSSMNTSSVQKPFGRLVVPNTSRSRYVSSGFWSRINDELDGLKMSSHGLIGDESESSEEEASPRTLPPTQELERTPSERHAFLFRHNLSPLVPELGEFHPLPSQIPFLLDVFSENVNFIIQIVHVPTIAKMIRNSRSSSMTHLTPSNEALMFSIYYAAITSMENDDVMSNFGSSKAELNFKYRLGLEHALAKADFLNAPDIVLVQAFAIFLSLVRRHDSPRFVWMMTGLLIRMSQYLGLQRDGSHFQHLSPFDIEMRRRVWWYVLMLDVRASEDQGTDLTVASGSFDTKLPLNINNADINPQSEQMPTERDGITDMSFARVSYGLWGIIGEMMGPAVKNGTLGLEDRGRMLNEIYERYEQGYLQYTTKSGNIAYWVAVTVARLLMAKMTLIVFLPVLFASPSENFSDEIKIKLLVSAIELAEYNHELNAEQACRQWRWVYQTYTHWHSIVYLMIEASRRPWSSIVERAWVALHSSWLIPAQSSMDKKLRIWIPLRKLMAKARKHRSVELNRLRADPQAAVKLNLEDQKFPQPSSSGPFQTGSSVDIFRKRWHQLVAMPEGSREDIQTSDISNTGFAESLLPSIPFQQTASYSSTQNTSDLGSHITFQSTYVGTSERQADQIEESTNRRDTEPVITINASSEPASIQTGEPAYNSLSTLPADWSASHNMGLGDGPWLWADSDPSVDAFSNLDMDSIDVNMDLDGEVNWYNWIESATGMER